MGTRNVELAREYLRAVESMGPAENVARFYSPTSNFTNFRIALCRTGACGGARDLQAAYGQAQKLLSSQRYDVRRVVENGDEVAVELEWTRRAGDRGAVDEFASGARDESVCRDVFDLSRWKNREPAKLRLLSAV